VLFPLCAANEIIGIITLMLMIKTNNIFASVFFIFMIDN